MAGRGLVLVAIAGLLQQGLGDAQQIQRVGGSLMVVPLMFGLPGIDTNHQVALGGQSPNEVLHVGRIVLPTKEHMLFSDGPVLAGAADLRQQALQARRRVIYRESLFENVSKSITK